MRKEPFDTAESLETPPLLFGKPSQSTPSMALKIKGEFAQKGPFQNLLPSGTELIQTNRQLKAIRKTPQSCGVRLDSNCPDVEARRFICASLESTGRFLNQGIQSTLVPVISFGLNAFCARQCQQIFSSGHFL
jgi:hypothetical protein